MAHPCCKSPGRIGGAAWSNGLVEPLKCPRVDDKPSGFIASNEASRLRQPVWLNVGKHKRKSGQLCSLEGLRMHFDYDYQYQKIEWMNKDVNETTKKLKEIKKTPCDCTLSVNETNRLA